ncbi:MAG: hypothetical protein QXT00_02310 [Ignisphaera sp.]
MRTEKRNDVIATPDDLLDLLRYFAYASVLRAASYPHLNFLQDAQRQMVPRDYGSARRARDGRTIYHAYYDYGVTITDALRAQMLSAFASSDIPLRVEFHLELSAEYDPSARKINIISELNLHTDELQSGQYGDSYMPFAIPEASVSVPISVEDVVPQDANAFKDWKSRIADVFARTIATVFLEMRPYFAVILRAVFAFSYERLQNSLRAQFGEYLKNEFNSALAHLKTRYGVDVSGALVTNIMPFFTFFTQGLMRNTMVVSFGGAVLVSPRAGADALRVTISGSCVIQSVRFNEDGSVAVGVLGERRRCIISQFGADMGKELIAETGNWDVYGNISEVDARATSVAGALELALSRALLLCAKRVLNTDFLARALYAAIKYIQSKYEEYEEDDEEVFV